MVHTVRDCLTGMKLRVLGLAAMVPVAVLMAVGCTSEAPPGTVPAGDRRAGANVHPAPHVHPVSHLHAHSDGDTRSGCHAWLNCNDRTD